MRIIFCIILTLCSLGIWAQSFSFEEALQQLSQGNKKLQGVQKQVQAAQWAQRANQGLMLPELSINGSYTHLSNDLFLDFNPYKSQITNRLPVFTQLLMQSGVANSPQRALMLGGLQSKLQNFMAKDWHYAFQNQNIWRLSADLKWVLFAGGKVQRAQKMSSIQTQIVQSEATAVEQILITDLAQYYFQYQLANEALAVRLSALNSANNHFTNAQKLEKEGLIAPIETLQAQRAVIDAQRELQGAQKDLSLVQTALLGVLGLEQEKNEVLLLTSPLFEVVNLQDLTYFQQQATENYPTLVQAKLKNELAEQNIHLKQSTFLPAVALVGKKYLWKENLPLTEPDNWYVGVGVQWNIFNGLQDNRRRLEAQTLAQSIELQREQAQKDIQTLVKKYYTEIQKQQEQYHSLSQSINFAEELLRIRQRSFAEGLATSAEVSDAELYRSSIAVKRLEALYKMDIALAGLLQTSGLSSTFINYLSK